MGERGGAPGLAASRSWTPLALTLGLHLLLVLAWLTGAHKPAPEPAPRASTLVLVRPLERPRPAPAVAPPPLPVLRTRQPAAFAAPLPAPAIPSTAPASSDPEPASAAQPEAAPGQAQPGEIPGELLARSKAMAGRIDRELRNGASPITAEPERKWERFAEAFAAARKNASDTVTLESYSAPDGVVIYRKTAGGKARCYRSGSVGGLVTGFGNADGHGAGSTTCPSGVSWTRL